MQPRLFDGFWFDARYALHSLRKDASLASIVVLTLALGIGANTAIFSIVKSVLIEPPPFAQPSQLTQARLRSAASGNEDVWVSPRDVADWRERSRSFEEIGSYRHTILDFLDNGPPESSYGVSVSHELMPMLGVRPALGRYFLLEEDQPGLSRVIILSDDLWRRFGAKQDIIGKRVHTSSGEYVVVGVMPRGFNFPLRLWSSLRVPQRMGFWIPIGVNPKTESRGRTNCNAILKLKPGVSIERAQSELSDIAAQLAREFPETNSSRDVRLVSLKDQIAGTESNILLMIFGAVGVVVLVVCANIASLLLVRGDRRRRELAIKQALGASQFRLARQVLTESLLLALAGGACGSILAIWLLQLMLRLSSHDIPRLADTHIDVTSLVFALVTTVAAGLLFGAFPVWRTLRQHPSTDLKNLFAGASDRNSVFAAGNVLVTLEVALALALTLGAALLVNSFARLMRVDPGFRETGLLASIIVLPQTTYSDQASGITFFRRVVEKLQRTPGIESAAASNSLPMSIHGSAAYLKIEGRQTSADDPMMLSRLHIVTADFPAVMGIDLLSGRSFSPHDLENSIKVALINEAAAKRFWPGEDALGKRFDIGAKYQVVGIVRNTLRSLDESPSPEVYVTIEQAAKTPTFVIAKSKMSRPELKEAVSRAAMEVDPQQAVFLTMSMEDLVSDSASRQRFSLWILGAFSATAVLLAAMGISSIVSYAVGKRKKEVGIRMALGARVNSVVRLVVKQGMKPVMIGIVLGLIVALGTRRMFSNLVFGIKPTDPMTFFLVSVLFCLVALIACYLPARRTAKVDPVEALRE